MHATYLMKFMSGAAARPRRQCGPELVFKIKVISHLNGESSGHNHFSSQSRKSSRILHQPSLDKGFIRRPLTTATVYEFFKSSAVNPDRFSAPQRSRLTFQHRHTRLKPTVSTENSQSVSQTCRAAGKKRSSAYYF